MTVCMCEPPEEMSDSGRRMINGRAASAASHAIGLNAAFHVIYTMSARFNGRDRERHGRPSAAKLILPLSLRARLLLLVAIVVTAVLTTATYLEVRSFERSVERELRRNGRPRRPCGRRRPEVARGRVRSRRCPRHPQRAHRSQPRIAVAVDIRGRPADGRGPRQHLIGGAGRGDRARARRDVGGSRAFRHRRAACVGGGPAPARWPVDCRCGVGLDGWRRAGAIAGPRSGDAVCHADRAARDLAHRRGHPACRAPAYRRTAEDDPARIRRRSHLARGYPPARRARHGGRRAQRHAWPAGAGERLASAARTGGDLGSARSQRRARRELSTRARAAGGSRARRTHGRRRRDGRQRRAPGWYAVEPRVGLRADDPRGSADADRACASASRLSRRSCRRSRTCCGRCSTRRGSRPRGSPPASPRSSIARARSPGRAWLARACISTSGWTNRCPTSMPTRRSSSSRC